MNNLSQLTIRLGLMLLTCIAILGCKSTPTTNNPPPVPVRRMLVLANGATVTNFASVTLAWDTSTDPTVTGYRVYEGASSGLYTNIVDAGTNTITTFSNLVYGATFYFSATCYNTAGLESQHSPEISWIAGAQVITNLVSISNQVLISSSPGGTWSPYSSWSMNLTNPPGVAYFKSQMTITQTNTAQQIILLDGSTLVLTNR